MCANVYLFVQKCLVTVNIQLTGIAGKGCKESLKGEAGKQGWGQVRGVSRVGRGVKGWGVRQVDEVTRVDIYIL